MGKHNTEVAFVNPGKWQQTATPKDRKRVDYWFTDDGRVVTFLDGAKVDNSPYAWVGSDTIQITYVKGSMEPVLKVAIDGGTLTLSEKNGSMKFARAGDLPSHPSHKVPRPN